MDAAKRRGKGRSKRPHLADQDRDYGELRMACSKRIPEEQPECLDDDTRRENCMLRCVSPACYDQVYAADPLEEGELDTTRGRLFRNCVRSEVMSERRRKKAEKEL